MLDSIYEIVPLVQKKSCVKGKKSCLFHQIQKCHAPCENKISKEEYAKIVENALEYIYNKTKLISKLNERMIQYSTFFTASKGLLANCVISNVTLYFFIEFLIITLL